LFRSIVKVEAFHETVTQPSDGSSGPGPACGHPPRPTFLSVDPSVVEPLHTAADATAGLRLFLLSPAPIPEIEEREFSSLSFCLEDCRIVGFFPTCLKSPEIFWTLILVPQTLVWFGVAPPSGLENGVRGNPLLRGYNRSAWSNPSLLKKVHVLFPFNIQTKL